ncbi:TonB-dependent receptor plug domain-containing protein [Marilutibacter chinensis]|uniref:TonB-dependent receptor n=1 Tax=Marilutibacter chinensis TaxID=2912247 RepID=A0ABS9HTC0_9GAMM|nr:TonB-dependent receptor [Lysobacter chinensis]MCF7222151.1 TonB-dependent receptor [Lysobacter chinensis]
MKAQRRNTLAYAIHASLLIGLATPMLVSAQDTPPDTTDPAKTLDTVTVTGTRIKQTNAVTAQPVFVLDRQKLEETGVQSVGEILQQLTASGQALNAKFNSSGNFGYPPDGGGIGAGSAQVDLRHLGSKRVLVLVDGIRWVNESSASGVSGSADVNTIPLAIVERIEVLEDGASAIYGSDAIAGVVNVITRRNFEGTEIRGYYGEYSKGGETTEASLTIGGGGERFNAVFGASYYEQKRISSGDWEQSAYPTPGTGVRGGSSGTPQGRAIFCDPSRPAGTVGFCDPATEFWYDVTLDDGTTNPVWNPADPDAGTYHGFTGADRFNFAPYNLLLTPSKRKALFTSLNFDITENVRLHAKALYNNRTSTNQAAPEPIFVGPFAGTGGIADTIIVHEDNPYNPYGITLDPASNFGFITKRPVEVGPRIFEQDVDTIYFNLGLDGLWNVGNGYNWDINLVHSENKAEQRFTNGYNVAKMKLALGDPAVCALVPGCVPLDLFGGQGRPMTQEMIDYIRTTQIDSSKQTLDILSANITGDLFPIGDRYAGFAAGVEHRNYKGDFNPDPLRQSGESQDSFAAAVSEEYDVSEVYAEGNFPLLDTLDVSAAIRYSDYSTFGGATTGKVGFRWQPIEDLVLRGTYSEGFRAPNLGELYGLTQFGATLVDPCGPTGNPGPVSPDFAAGCAAQGAPPNFEQANTQITTFTGGNPDLEPEESDSYTFGVVYAPAWAEGQAWSDRLDFELSYYNHEIDGAIQARDLQALLEACLRAGGTVASSPTCAPFTRQSSGNLNPPENFLDNLGTVETDGLDIKVNWNGPEWGWGRLSASLQATTVFNYEAVDIDGNKSQREVGIEVNDSAIPDWQTNLSIGWALGDWNVNWTSRYISAVDEYCSNVPVGDAPGCMGGVEKNTLGSTTFHDLQVAWSNAFNLEGLKLSAGANNVFGKEPPVCLSCSLNGYDAGTYDLPDAFWYVSADYRF